MNVDDYCVWLEQEMTAAIKFAIADTMTEVARRVRNDIPPDRVKTRRAVQNYVRVKPWGYQGIVRLVFAKKFPLRNTKTQKLFGAAARRTRPMIRPSFERRLNNHLKKV